MPSRKPKSQHELEGTWDRAAANASSDAMRTADGLPTMPADLDDVAKACWVFVCRTRASWLAVADGLTLRHLCELWSLRTAAYAVLKANPVDKLARTAFYQFGGEFTKLGARFGLTPADRAKLGDTDPEDYDPAAEFVS